MADPAVVSLLGGAIVGGFGTWAVDSLRWRRQTSYRWDETRLSAYVDFVESVSGAAVLLSEVSLLKRSGDAGGAAEKLQSFREQRDQVLVRLARVRVVGSKDVADSAIAVRDALADWRGAN